MRKLLILNLLAFVTVPVVAAENSARCDSKPFTLAKPQVKAATLSAPQPPKAAVPQPRPQAVASNSARPKAHKQLSSNLTIACKRPKAD